MNDHRLARYFRFCMLVVASALIVLLSQIASRCSASFAHANPRGSAASNRAEF